MILPLLVAVVSAAPPSDAGWSAPEPPAAVAASDGELIVEGERPDAPDPSATATSVTVIEVDERLPADADVAQVVDSAAGARVRRLGGLGDWAAVSIRGSTTRQVEVFLDGVPLNPDGASTVDLSELPLSAFRRVEVYRGNAPPALGAAPMGGVVNLVTGDIDEARRISAAAGSHGTGRVTAVGGASGEGQTDTLLVAELFHTRGDFDAFSDNATPYALTDDHLGPRENNDKSQLAVHGRWRVGGDRLRLTLLDALLARDEGLPGPVDAPARATRLQTGRNLAVAEVDAHGDATRVVGRLWALHRQEETLDSEGELGLAPQHTDARTSTGGLLLHGLWVPVPWAAPAATLSARRDGWRSRDLLADRELGPRSRLSGGLALSATLRDPSERFSATPVARLTVLDDRDLGSGADDALATSVDPRLGLLVRPWQPGPLALKANVGHYLRPPDFTELFGSTGTLTGNPDLRPERGWQWDVGGRLVVPDNPTVRASLEVTHFWNTATDLVTWVQNSQHTLIAANVGKAWVQGVEGALTLDLAHLLDSQTSLTRTVSVNLSEDTAISGNQLPRVPAWEVWQATSLHRGETARLGHTLSWTDGNYWDATNWFRAAPRAVHGAFVRARPGPEAPSFELSVLNLADHIVEVTPRNALGDPDGARAVQPLVDFDGYALPGRTWLFTVRWDR